MLYLCAILAFGDSFESGVFGLDTQSPPAVTGSVFTCNLRKHIGGSDVFIADTMAVPVDTDGDGLPNIWEMRYFENTVSAVALGHDDLDGEDNLSEYITGTNPTNSASVFVVCITNGPAISWQSISNRNYTIQFSSDLSTFANVVDQAEISGTGEEMTYFCSSNSASGGFYRVEVEFP
jgi:hypothetical protein